LNQAVFENPGQPKYIPFIYLNFQKVDVCIIIILRKSKTGSDFHKITVHFSSSKKIISEATSRVIRKANNRFARKVVIWFDTVFPRGLFFRNDAL
jgi:hypothetical protein